MGEMNNLNIYDLLFDDEEAVGVVLAALMLENLNELFFGEENDGDREPFLWVRIAVDVEGFRRLPDPTFRAHFRMSKPTFQGLVLDVGNHLRERGRIHRLRTPIHKSLMMTLWILSNTDTFRSTALHFGVSPGVVHFHYLYIIEALREMAPYYIQWPTREERVQTKNFFAAFSGYPGAVGCIDGMHSYITAPIAEKHAYTNRHHTYSLVTQAVCDHNLLIRDVHVGEPGSMHDSRIFRRSPLSTNLLENNELLDADEHLLGDGAYKLTDKLLVPYDDNGALTPRQRKHNLCHSRIRSAIERAFGRLKNKFRRLRHFYSLRIEYALDHIVACLVLHNYIILSGERLAEVADVMEPVLPRIGSDEEEEDGHRDQEDRLYLGDREARAENQHPLLARAQVAGFLKRDRIADQLEDQ